MTAKLHTIENITPITVGNPDAIDGLAIDQAHLEEYVNPGSESSVVGCERPPRGFFFTVRAETSRPWKDRGFYFVLEMKGRDPYLVMPNIAKQKDEDTISPRLIVRYVTMAGDEALWPIKLNPLDGGKGNAWNTSALNILKLAESGWIRIVSNLKSGHYRHQPSKKTLDVVPPQFTDRAFEDLINIAFKDRIVTTLDHEIWDILENGAEK